MHMVAGSHQASLGVPAVRGPAWLVRERSIILLVMQSVDNSLTVSGKARPVRSLAVDVRRRERAEPDLIPVNNEAAKLLSQRIGVCLVGTTAT